MILEVFFLKLEKYLTRFSTMVSYLNWNKMLSDSLHMILQDNLDELREVVVLNSRVYSWTSVTAGVPFVLFHLHE